MIASKVRAAELVEEIADKYAISVPLLLCARWDRYALLARAEVATVLIDELGWSLRTVGGYLGCSHQNVCQLLACHKKHADRIARIGAAMPPPDPEGRIRELEAELERLAGTRLCERLAASLGLRMRCAITLAILIEHFPNYVRGPAMLQLYDEACEQLGYGGRRGASRLLMTRNRCDLKAHFAQQGWPEIVEPGPYQSVFRLTCEGARFLSDEVGAPRRVLVERAFAQQSPHVRDLAHV